MLKCGCSWGKRQWVVPQYKPPHSPSSTQTCCAKHSHCFEVKAIGSDIFVQTGIKTPRDRTVFATAYTKSVRHLPPWEPLEVLAYTSRFLWLRKAKMLQLCRYVPALHCWRFPLSYSEHSQPGPGVLRGRAGGSPPYLNHQWTSCICQTRLVCIARWSTAPPPLQEHYSS